MRKSLAPTTSRLMHTARKSASGNTQSGMTNMMKRLFDSAIQNSSLSNSSRWKCNSPTKTISVSPSQRIALQKKDLMLGTTTKSV